MKDTLTNGNMERRLFLSFLAATGPALLASSYFSSIRAQETNKNVSEPTTTQASDERSPMNCADVPKIALICISLHHQNTKKIADAIAKVYNISVLLPQQVTAEQLQHYDLIGLGSGIYSQRHHDLLFDLVNKVPDSIQKKSFIFSTSGVSQKFAVKYSIDDPHTALRDLLIRKNWTVLDEFNCVGWNTNSFLRFFGGMNRGRPNVKDYSDVEFFARELIKNV